MNKSKPVTVLHLTPHAGGGVGTVLRAFIKNSSSVSTFRHTLATLDYLNPPTKEWCQKNNIEYFENTFKEQSLLLSLLGKYDIIHIHWWNHPLLHAFLALPNLPSMRTVLWAHVNGMYVPQIFFQAIVEFPDFFVLATPYSLESPLFTCQKARLTRKPRIIQSNAGVPEGAPVQIIKSDNFTVGYVGTVDYSKMHPDFISIWSEARINEAPLIVCGGLAEDALRNEVATKGVDHLFDIRGKVDNVPEVLSALHVFMYPLVSTHYGTGEQVLLEAMAFGAVPVVMDNGCERFLVKDGETGIIASGKKDFIQALLFLKNNPEKRQQMAENGRKSVHSLYAIEQTVSQWHSLYEELLACNKRKHHLRLNSIKKLPLLSPTSLLINSYSESAEAQKLLSLLYPDSDWKHKTLADLSPACFSNTRGSPFHYQKSLPGDPSLDRICRFLQETQMNSQKTL